MIEYFVPDDVINPEPRPISRHAELTLKAGQLSVPITTEDQHISYGEGSSVELYYEHNREIRCIKDAKIERINYTILSDKHLNWYNLSDSFQIDIFIDSVEILSSQYGYDKIRPSMLRAKQHGQFTETRWYPEIIIYTEFWDHNVVQQSIGSEWKDFGLLDDPTMLNRGRYVVKCFGYHRADNDVLTIDSVALHETQQHRDIIANFRQPLQIGHLYSN